MMGILPPVMFPVRAGVGRTTGTVWGFGLASCTIRVLLHQLLRLAVPTMSATIRRELVGYHTGSYAAGQITSREAVGGRHSRLQGQAQFIEDRTPPKHCRSRREQVGGLVRKLIMKGMNHNSYATSTVQGDRDTVWAFVGFSDEKGIVFNSTTTGRNNRPGGHFRQR